jgi:hypothetical protein
MSRVAGASHTRVVEMSTQQVEQRALRMPTVPLDKGLHR